MLFPCATTALKHQIVNYRFCFACKDISDTTFVLSLLEHFKEHTTFQLTTSHCWAGQWSPKLLMIFECLVHCAVKVINFNFYPTHFMWIPTPYFHPVTHITFFYIRCTYPFWMTHWLHDPFDRYSSPIPNPAALILCVRLKEKKLSFAKFPTFFVSKPLQLC